jgi:GNAT superfamily N-acetyltransferase
MTPRHTTLADGTRLVARDLRPEDAPSVAAALERLSPASRYQRFLTPVDQLPAAQLRYLTDVDRVHHLALGVALAREDESEGQPIAIARCVREAEGGDLAEVAVTVDDAWQGRGVGRYLIGLLRDQAWAAGIRRWRASLLSQNRAAIRLLERVGELEVTRREAPGVAEMTVRLRPPRPADE